MKYIMLLGRLLFISLLTVSAPCFAQAPDEGHQGHVDEPMSGEESLGKVHFSNSCDASVQADFNRGVALLHSFWFTRSTEVFTDISKRDPSCGMAWWGLAMGHMGNPFSWPPLPELLSKGWEAAQKAKTVGAKTQRERDYIAAVEIFYKDYDKIDHQTRAKAYTKAMEALASRYPKDSEAAIFYALALIATAPPTDKTYAQQLKATSILAKYFRKQPNHPGLAHYLIHGYDAPPLSKQGLAAAKRYSKIAPAAPHALHMPSHIFTRLGYWQESIDSNRASVQAAKEANEQANQLHAMDYMVYAHLQLAQDKAARKIWEEMRAIPKPHRPANAIAFAFAAVPARLAIERRDWKEAASLALFPADYAWQRFPQTEATLVFAHALGSAKTGDLGAARKDIERLRALQQALTIAGGQAYWVEQVGIQIGMVQAFLAQAEGKDKEALTLMQQAVDQEDATEKSAVTPGPLAPARELLGDLLLELKQPKEALQAFEATRQKEPNRLRTIFGAAQAAEQAGDSAKATRYYQQLLKLAQHADTDRPEIQQAKRFLARKRS
jgi:hypothetical protein